MKEHPNKNAPEAKPSKCNDCGNSSTDISSGASDESRFHQRSAHRKYFPQFLTAGRHFPSTCKLHHPSGVFAANCNFHHRVILARDNAKRLAETILGNPIRAGMTPAGGRFRNHATFHEMKRLSSTPATNGVNTPLHCASYSSGLCRLDDSSTGNISDLKSDSFQFPVG